MSAAVRGLLPLLLCGAGPLVHAAPVSPCASPPCTALLACGLLQSEPRGACGPRFLFVVIDIALMSECTQLAHTNMPSEAGREGARMTPLHSPSCRARSRKPSSIVISSALHAPQGATAMPARSTSTLPGFLSELREQAFTQV